LAFDTAHLSACSLPWCYENSATKPDRARQSSRKQRATLAHSNRITYRLYVLSIGPVTIPSLGLEGGF
jgi:hypothetical protein